MTGDQCQNRGCDLHVEWGYYSRQEGVLFTSRGGTIHVERGCTSRREGGTLHVERGCASRRERGASSREGGASSQEGAGHSGRICHVNFTILITTHAQQRMRNIDPRAKDDVEKAKGDGRLLSSTSSCDCQPIVGSCQQARW